MSLQYRAIWEDDHTDLLEKGKTAFQDWLDGKRANLMIPEVGTAADGPYKVRADRVRDDDRPEIEALRLRLDELRAPEGTEEQWITTTYWMTNGESGWVWIDLEWIADNISTRRPIFAPGLARRLLSLRTTQSDTDNLGPRPIIINSDDDLTNLYERLYSTTRSVPLVLFSFDRYSSFSKNKSRASDAARRLAGCADVRLLTQQAQRSFHKDCDPISMSVFDGAVRIYLPSIDPHVPEPWKHRYVLRRHLSAEGMRAVEPVAWKVLPRVVAQKPPPIYFKQIRRLFNNRDWLETAAQYADEIDRLQDQTSDLRQEIASLNELLEWEIEQGTESEKKAAESHRKLEILQHRVRVLGAEPTDIDTESIDDVLPSSCEDAISLARQLELVMIHPDAPRRITEMDQDMHSEQWALKIYSSLRSLEAYARSKSHGFEGNFREWCRESGESEIPLNKVALSESSSVRNRSKYIAARSFPVDRKVEPSGKLLMEAHIKVVLGGGMTIPRIYFHDDTTRTGEVHIGFIGPHDLVPNLSKN